jgi:signal peptidase I
MPSRRRPAKADSGPSGWRGELWDWFRALLFALVVVLLLRTFVFQLTIVKMHSMEPTLYEKDWLFVNKIAYRIGHPDRGDVVILKDPRDTADRRDYLVKRVVGLPGDRLEIREGYLYINGELFVEPYTDTLIEDGDFGPVQVNDGHYFVLGDNRHQGGSLDSRSFGEVQKSKIIGRADVRIWPIMQWSKL